MRKQFLQSRKDSFERLSLIRIHDATFYRLNRVARKAQLQLTVITTRVRRSALHYISDRLWQAVARLFSSATPLRGDPEQAVGTSFKNESPECISIVEIRGCAASISDQQIF